jgi:hypothetical protein
MWLGHCELELSDGVGEGYVAGRRGEDQEYGYRKGAMLATCKV